MSTSIAGFQRKPGGETYLFKAAGSAGNIFTVGNNQSAYARVSFITSDYASGYIRAYNAGQYGQNWVVKSGGAMVVGGGESAENLYANNVDNCATDGIEQLYLSSDSLVHVYSNANTIENRKHWYFNNVGQIYLPDGVARISEDGNIYLNTAAVTGWLSTILSNLMPAWVNRHTAFNNVSVPSGSNVDLGSFSLASAGVYLIQLTVQYAANANGDRHVWVSSASGGNAVSLQAHGQIRAASSGNTIVHAICFANPSSAITYYVVGNQNSGATLNANVRINIIRLMAQ